MSLVFLGIAGHVNGFGGVETGVDFVGELGVDLSLFCFVAQIILNLVYIENSVPWLGGVS